MKKNVLLSTFLLFLVMLVDGQVSTLLVNLLPFGAVISSRLLLLSLVFLSGQKAEIRNVAIFALIGLLYDIYYLDLIGIATTLLPIKSR